MKLTVENAIEIAKKHGFSYKKELLEIVIPSNIYIDDDYLTFLRFENGSKGLEYRCVHEFGLIAHKNGKFGYRTVMFKTITTTEELEENIKNFLSFIELTKPLEKKYAERVKLNKMDGDF